MKKELSSVLGIYNVSQKDRRSTCSALPHPDFSLSCFPALRDFALLSHLSLSSPKASPMNEYNDNISVAWSKLNSFCSSSPDHFLPVLIQWKTPLSSYLFSLIPSQNMEVLLNHLSLFPPPQWGHYEAFRRPPWFVPPLPSTFTSSVLPLVFMIWTSVDKCSSY